MQTRQLTSNAENLPVFPIFNQIFSFGPYLVFDEPPALTHFLGGSSGLVYAPPLHLPLSQSTRTHIRNGPAEVQNR